MGWEANAVRRVPRVGLPYANARRVGRLRFARRCSRRHLRRYLLTRRAISVSAEPYVSISLALSLGTSNRWKCLGGETCRFTGSWHRACRRLGFPFSSPRRNSTLEPTGDMARSGTARRRTRITWGRLVPIWYETCDVSPKQRALLFLRLPRTYHIKSGFRPTSQSFPPSSTVLPLR